MDVAVAGTVEGEEGENVGEEQDRFGFTSLPLEVQAHAFSFLPVPALLMLSLVSKDINAVASDDSLWRPICQQRANNPSLALAGPSWKRMYGTLVSAVLVVIYNNDAMASNLQAELKKEGIMADVFSTEQHDWISDLATKVWSYSTVLLGSDQALSGGYGSTQHRLGELLAAYVERGRSVILTGMLNSSPEHCLGGRWKRQGYDPIRPASFVYRGDVLGSVLVPEHDIMQNIRHLTTRVMQTGSSNSRGRMIALWRDFYIAAAELDVPAQHRLYDDYYTYTDGHVEVGPLPPPTKRKDPKRSENPGLVVSLSILPNNTEGDAVRWIANACRYAKKRAAE